MNASRGSGRHAEQGQLDRSSRSGWGSSESSVPASSRDGLRSGVVGDAQGARSAEPKRGPFASALLAIGSGVMVALLIVIAAIAALAIVVPAVTGARALTVLTSSMEPTLPPGTLIVTRATEIADIEVGDVLTYQLKSGEATLVTHRVMQRLTLADGEVRFITQGDNSPAPDRDPVRPVQVVGTLWYSVPYLGWVPQALNGPTRSWLVPAIVAGLFGYAAWMLGSGLRDRRNGRGDGTAAEAEAPANSG